MAPEHWQRVKEMFAAALEQEPAARAGFVARAAADDPTLAEEVLRLLASHEKAGTFLSTPPSPTSLGLVAEGFNIFNFHNFGCLDFHNFLPPVPEVNKDLP